MTSTKGTFNSIPKQRILESFKAHVKPNSKILPLIDSLEDIFSKELLEPENYNKSYPSNPREILSGTTGEVQNRIQQKPIQRKRFIPKSPFSSSGISSNTWWYIDEEGNFQGPFETVLMDKWYNEEFFPRDLQIRYREQDRFVKMIDLLGKEQTQNQFYGRQYNNQGQNDKKDSGLNRSHNKQGNEGGWERARTYNKNQDPTDSGQGFRRNFGESKESNQTKANDNISNLQITRNTSSQKEEEGLKNIPEAQTVTESKLENQSEKAQQGDEKLVKENYEQQKGVEEPKKEKINVNEVLKQVEEVKEEKLFEKDQEDVPEKKPEKPEETVKFQESVEIDKPEKVESRIQKDDLFGGEWKVTFTKNPKGKKGKGGKKGQTKDDEIEENQPEHEITIPVKAKIELKEDLQAPSPSKKVAAQNQEEKKTPQENTTNKKKLITNWTGEEKSVKYVQSEKLTLEELSSTSEAYFPSLGDSTKPTTKVESKVPKKEKKVDEQKLEKKESECVAKNDAKDDFPTLVPVRPQEDEFKPSQKTQQKKQEKIEVAEPKPMEKLIQKATEFNSASKNTNDDFPSLGGSKEDFPTLGKTSKTQTVAAEKKTAKTQKAPVTEPLKKSSAQSIKPKETISNNPKYLADFPSL